MKTSLLLLLLFLTPYSASAGFLVEPYLGFGQGDQESEVSDLNYDEDISRFDAGLRVGYQMMGVFGGLEYSRSLITETDVRDFTDYESSAFGLFVGYEFPILVRVYAGYSMEVDGDFKKPRGPNIDLDGEGLYLAFGLIALPFVSINLEYHRNDFDESRTRQSTSLLDDTDDNYLFLSVSLPFNTDF